MTSYHIIALYDTSSIEIGCPKIGAQFNKCGLQECAKYALIELLGNSYSITYLFLLVANLATTKWCKKPENWLKPWLIGTYLGVLMQELSNE